MNRKPSLSKELQAAEHFVRLAMAQAELAARSGNAPFGAVIVDTLGDVVAAEHNRVRETLDPSAHAEINAIRVACGRARRATLEGYRLYVNKEPCPMCIVCAVEAKLSAVYFGDPDDGSASVALPLLRSCVALQRTTECRCTVGSWLRRASITASTCYAGILPDPHLAGAPACLRSSASRDHPFWAHGEQGHEWEGLTLLRTSVPLLRWLRQRHVVSGEDLSPRFGIEAVDHVGGLAKRIARGA